MLYTDKMLCMTEKDTYLNSVMVSKQYVNLSHLTLSQTSPGFYVSAVHVI